MREWLRNLFLRDPGKGFSRLCPECALRQQTIEIQSNQIGFLQDCIKSTQARRAPADQTRPMATTPQPWNSMKKKLEEKYSRNRDKPEDQVKSHWEDKIKTMEKEAGINASSS